jgi:hypothetical protein
MAPARRDESRPATLNTEEARQGDDDRETLRVLDISLALAVLGFVILGVFFAVFVAA